MARQLVDGLPVGREVVEDLEATVADSGALGAVPQALPQGCGLGAAFDETEGNVVILGQPAGGGAVAAAAEGSVEDNGAAGLEHRVGAQEMWVSASSTPGFRRSSLSVPMVHLFRALKR